MSLHNDLIQKQYRDTIGQIHIWPRTPDMAKDMGISQNGQLFLAQAHLLMLLNGEFDNEEVFAEEWANYVASMDSCQVYGEACFSRHPHTHTEEWQSPDNLIGICTSSYTFLDTSFPAAILHKIKQDNGKYKWSDLLKEVLDQSKWYNKLLTTIGSYINLPYVYRFHESQPFKQTFWGRQPGLIAMLKLASGQRPNILEFFGFIVAQLISAHTKLHRNRDPFHLGWMCSHITKDKGFVYKLLHKYFIYRCKKKFKDMNYAKDIYWSENPAHPCVDYWKWD